MDSKNTQFLYNIKQKELEFTLHTAQLGYWNLNLSTGVAERSLLHDQIFGYSTRLAEWTYTIFLNHVHPEDKPRVDQAFKAAVAHHTAWEVECRIYRVNDPCLRWIWAAGNIVEFNEGTHMLGLIQDITERKKNEASIAMLSSLVEFSDEAILGLDLQGIVFSWNKAAEKLYGYTQEEISGCSITKLYPPDKAHELGDILHKIALGESVKQMETIRAHKDGRLIPISITVSPIKNATGDIVGVTAMVRDITEQKIMLEKLKHLAQHDPLTGLINRPLFEDRIVQAIAYAKRQKNNFAVGFLDFDDFKSINDRYGHTIGDLLLSAVAKSMQNNIRGIDSLARLGGDEFGLILLGIDNDRDIVQLIHRITTLFSKGFHIDNKTLKISFSLGIAMYPKDGAQSLIEKADAAMYYVKKHGKNNFKLFDANDCTHYS